VVPALDRAPFIRRAPTYALTDTERTVSVDHVCGVAVRNPQIFAVALYSVPSALVDERAWAALMAASSSSLTPRGAVGPREVARHALITPGRPTIQDEHYSRRPTGAIERKRHAASATSRRSCQGPAQPRGSGPVARSGASRAALASVGEIFTRHGR
jgi:hypothetical protein